MTLEDQIAALLARAEPLRLLPDDEAEAKGLPGLVEKINALRAKQAAVNHAAGMAVYNEQKMADKIIAKELGAALASLVADEPVTPLPGEEIGASKNELDDMRGELLMRGVKVDRRWGESRLRAELAASASVVEGADAA